MRPARDPALAILPAALEIERTPPLPAARALLWTIALCAVCAAIWSIHGKVDIVGVAPGRVVTSGRTKLVQPLAAAVVSRIHVHEGQHVRRGELLVELDPTPARAARARLETQCALHALDEQRLRQLLQIAGEAAAPPSTPVPAVGAAVSGASAAAIRGAQQLRGAQLAEFRASLASLDDSRREKQAARAAAAARVRQLALTLPLATEEAEAHRKLTDTGVVPRMRWLEVERRRIAVEQELAAQRAEHAVLDAALAGIAARRAATLAQYRARWMTEQAEAGRQLVACREGLIGTARDLALTTLTAPVTGTVQQLAVNTAGGVVTPAQPLMLIAPDDAPLEIEARVPNRDIGFVRVGQRASVKLDTFNYTRYGFLHGRVVRLSRDAVVDAERDSHYLAQLALDATTLKVDGRRVSIEPGMTASVEFAMGRRRIIEFLLSPLLRYRGESARER